MHTSKISLGSLRRKAHPWHLVDGLGPVLVFHNLHGWRQVSRTACLRFAIFNTKIAVLHRRPTHSAHSHPHRCAGPATVTLLLPPSTVPVAQCFILSPVSYTAGFSVIIFLLIYFFTMMKISCDSHVLRNHFFVLFPIVIFSLISSISSPS